MKKHIFTIGLYNSILRGLSYYQWEEDVFHEFSALNLSISLRDEIFKEHRLFCNLAMPKIKVLDLRYYEQCKRFGFYEYFNDYFKDTLSLDEDDPDAYWNYQDFDIFFEDNTLDLIFYPEYFIKDDVERELSRNLKDELSKSINMSMKTIEDIRMTYNIPDCLIKEWISRGAIVHSHRQFP